uniref:Uncharacterized protein n=1 Tax=Cacopsylla melanoneura TaxID=428564 RepID=A0A8D9BVW9_9HEMI
MQLHTRLSHYNPKGIDNTLQTVEVHLGTPKSCNYIQNCHVHPINDRSTKCTYKYITSTCNYIQNCQINPISHRSTKCKIQTQLFFGDCNILIHLKFYIQTSNNYNFALVSGDLLEFNSITHNSFNKFKGDLTITTPTQALIYTLISVNILPLSYKRIKRNLHVFL